MSFSRGGPNNTFAAGMPNCLLILYSILLLTACSDMFKAEKEHETSTFSVGRVEMVRAENLEFNTAGLPTKKLFEYRTEILDKGLEIEVVGENFFIVANGHSTSTITDFNGELVWSLPLEVNPENQGEKIPVKTKVIAQGRHRGEEVIELTVRPWLEHSSQVIDTRYQADKDSPDLIAESVVKVFSDEAEIAYQFDAFELDQNLNLFVKKDYQITLDPKVFRPGSASYIAGFEPLSSGSFTAELALVRLDKTPRDHVEVLEYVKNCGNHCVIADQTLPAVIRSGKIDLNFTVEFPFHRMPDIRFRNILLIHLRPNKAEREQGLEGFSAYALWTITDEDPKVELRELDEWPTLYSPQRQESRLLSVEDQQQLLQEVYEAEPMPDNIKRRLKIITPELWQQNWSGDVDDLRKRANEICLAMQEELEAPTRNLWEKGVRLWESLDDTMFSTDTRTGPCHEFPDETLNLNRMFVSRNLKSYEQLPNIFAIQKIEVQNIAFKEVRSDRQENKAEGRMHNHIFQASKSGELGLKIPFTNIGFRVKAGGVTQNGYQSTRMYVKTDGTNDRVRNSILRIDQLYVEKIPFRLEMQGFYCMTIKPYGAEKTYLHCDTENLVHSQMEENWYYLYGRVPAGNQTFLADPRSGRQNQFSMVLQGKKNFHRMQRLFENKARQFELILDKNNKTIKEIDETTSKVIRSQNAVSTMPGVILY